MLDGMSDSIQRSRIENLHSREVDRQSPTGLIFLQLCPLVWWLSDKYSGSLSATWLSYFPDNRLYVSIMSPLTMIWLTVALSTLHGKVDVRNLKSTYWNSKNRSYSKNNADLHTLIHPLWSSRESPDIAISFTLRFLNSSASNTQRPSSVVQTGVKSRGWENSTAHLSTTILHKLIIFISCTKAG